MPEHLPLTDDQCALLLDGERAASESLRPLADHLWLTRDDDPELVALARIVRDVTSRAKWHDVGEFPAELLVAAAVRESLVQATTPPAADQPEVPDGEPADSIQAWFDSAWDALERVRQVVESSESERHRDEATRHVVDQPYADNRYVHLLDSMRQALRDAPLERGPSIGTGAARKTGRSTAWMPEPGEQSQPVPAGPRGCTCGHPGAGCYCPPSNFAPPTSLG